MSGELVFRRGKMLITSGVLAVVVGGVGVVLSLPAAATKGDGNSVAQVLASVSAADLAAPLASAVPSFTGSLEGSGLIDRRTWGDVDGDNVPDMVEQGLCGSATCASPWDDTDADGVTDAVEFLACGSATCADPAVDGDLDAIPDYVSTLLCGPAGCSREVLHGDIDGDGIENWIEAVIAGDAYSATGTEDFNGNGASDANELAQCAIDAARLAALASTGVSPWMWVFAAIALIGAGAAGRGIVDERRVVVASAAVKGNAR